MLGNQPLGGLVLASTTAAGTPDLAPLSERHATVTSVGSTSAVFIRPVLAAMFEQADTLVIH